jgi:hypothetical protein
MAVWMSTFSIPLSSVETIGCFEGYMYGTGSLRSVFSCAKVDVARENKYPSHSHIRRVNDM